MVSLEALQALRVLVVHPRDADGETIRRLLLRIGCQIEDAWPPPRDLPERVSMVFYLLDETTVRVMPWTSGSRKAAVVAVVAGHSPSNPRPCAPRTLRLLNDCWPQAVISKPVRAVDVLTSLMSARSLARHEECLVTKVRKLEETLRTTRAVEKAKAILMRSKNIDERTAYRHLRESAMNRRVPIGSIASAVINASDIFAQYGEGTASP